MSDAGAGKDAQGHVKQLLALLSAGGRVEAYEITDTPVPAALRRMSHPQKPKPFKSPPPPPNEWDSYIERTIRAMQETGLPQDDIDAVLRHINNLRSGEDPHAAPLPGGADRRRGCARRPDSTRLHQEKY